MVFLFVPSLVDGDATSFGGEMQTDVTGRFQDRADGWLGECESEVRPAEKLDRVFAVDILDRHLRGGQRPGQGEQSARRRSARIDIVGNPFLEPRLHGRAVT